MNMPTAAQPFSTTTPMVLTKRAFNELGISVVDWARERGFSPDLVYAVLAGRRKCLRGQSFRIAKELGMK